MIRIIAIIAFTLVWLLGQQSFGQKNLEFQGQASAFGSYSPDATPDLMIGGRYIPELLYNVKVDSFKKIDFEVSANMYGTTTADRFSSFKLDGKVEPYRLWARYTGKQFEFRFGLQKIDFGSATLLRPLQWFNQIDPRDPLQLTNGVYGALGRYYFLNNANIWIWTLYGNEKARGFDAVETYKKDPEFGGRIQHPVPKGEMGLSYHHRTANAQKLFPISEDIDYLEKIPEERVALDGKWDVVIGLWFEASYIHKQKNIGLLTNQTLLNIGADYTFGLGNGLNVVAEHLVMSMDEQAFRFKQNSNITASTITYPIGLFNNLTSVLYYAWDNDSFSFFLNYEHQFKRITGYVMGYYNAKSQQGIQENELLNTASGPGFRLMLVYNH